MPNVAVIEEFFVRIVNLAGGHNNGADGTE
jgi:hypothetical protein